MHDKSMYEVNYPDGTTEQLNANIIAEGHHYQVLTEVTYHNIYDRYITKLKGYIKSINGNLHRKRKTCGWIY